MGYATDADLLVIQPNITSFGVVSWLPQLNAASADVLERIKTEWWPEAVTSRFGFQNQAYDINPAFPSFDEAKLNTAAIKNLTIYWALAHYIYPILTKDRDDADAFSRRMERYQKFYDEEWERVKVKPLYDFNADSQFTDIERRSGMTAVRVSRA